ILAKIWPASYQVRPELSPLIVMEQIDLSLRYGNAELSPFAYATFGLILIGVRGEIELGYEFGQLALKLLGVLNSQAIEARTIAVFYNFVAPWKQHIKDTLQPFLTAYASGLETGDLEWAGYGLCNYCTNAYFTGFNLNELVPIFEKYIEVLRTIKQEQTINYVSAFRQSILSLLEPTTDAEKIISQADEAKIREYQDRKDFFPLFMTYLQQSILCYLFGNYNGALEYSLLAEKYVGAVVAHIAYSQFYFQDSLIHLAACENLAQLDREATIARVNSNQEKVKKWADCAPMNYLHKFNLVEAEKYRVSGKNYEAGDLYDRAISGARENGYIQEEALAHELAAKFYLNWGKEKVAAGYMQEAYYGYAHWGATAKVNDLEQRYPDLLGPILQNAQPPNPPETFRTIAAPYCSIHASTQTGHSSSTSSVNVALDFAAILKASQSLSSTIQLDDLLHQLTQIILQNSGADRCALILPNAERVWEVRAIATPENTQLCHDPLQDNPDLPTKLIYYVKNTKAVAIVDDCKTDLPVIDDYLTQRRPKSILCLPILNQGNLIGILYLKNRLTSGVFTRDRIATLQLLTRQAAIALENARLYQQVATYSQTLEAEVERKTQTLHQQNQALEQALQQVRQTQAQLIHAEKMSSLGQMVAGIAHEINNPVNFIKGNIEHTQSYFADLVSLLSLYQQEYLKPTDAIAAKSEEIDLDFLIQDISQILSSMKIGTDRIQKIVLSLRSFARLDEAKLKKVDIHEGIESTLLIVQHRCQPSDKQPQIQVVKDYGTLPTVTCYPSQLNQVFLHIFNNAIDAIRENTTSDTTPEIRIRTRVAESGQIRIQIANTHSFVPEEIQTQIFNPFFTTKPVGQGAGLGLSVSYSIIQKHQGTLTVRSQPGEGTEFEIAIAQRVCPENL
ncbi:MAG: ATP-binding protein, partial [Microcoleus sp.]